MTTGEKPPSITRRETTPMIKKNNLTMPFENAVEDDVDDPKMKMTVKLRGELDG